MLGQGEGEGGRKLRPPPFCLDWLMILVGLDNDRPTPLPHQAYPPFTRSKYQELGTLQRGREISDLMNMRGQPLAELSATFRHYCTVNMQKKRSTITTLWDVYGKHQQIKRLWLIFLGLLCIQSQKTTRKQCPTSNQPPSPTLPQLEVHFLS